MELSFKQVESVFMERFGIMPDRADAFRGRLQHLQRAGVPSEVNTGKGTRASYGWRQLVELTVALDLIDLGLRPEIAVARVRINVGKLLGSLRRVVLNFADERACMKSIHKGRCTFKMTEVLVTSAGILSISQGDHEDAGYLLTVSAADFQKHIGRDPGLHPAEAHFDFGSRMMFVAKLAADKSASEPLAIARDLILWSRSSALNELQP